MKIVARIAVQSLIPVLLIFSNCSDKDEPVIIPDVGFKTSASVILEGGVISIEFNIPLPNGVVPVFTLSGTATVEVDYSKPEITANAIVINTIENEPNTGAVYDPDETIIITLTGFTGNANVAGITVHTVTINETPLIIGLGNTASTRVEGLSSIVSFTQSLPEGVSPTYTIEGTAIPNTDFTVIQNSNGFVFTTLKDELYDPNETVILTLTGFTGNVVLGTNVKFTLTITDEDEAEPARLAIDLTWDAGDGTAGDVDMDMLIWIESPPGSNTYELKFVVDFGTSLNPFEKISIPANETNGKYGVSYVYYSGAAEPLKFNVKFRSYKGNIDGKNRASFDGTYQLVNRNQWDITMDYKIEQYYVKNGSNYSNLSALEIPAQGSRLNPPKFIVDFEALRNSSMKLKQRTRGL